MKIWRNTKTHLLHKWRIANIIEKNIQYIKLGMHRSIFCRSVSGTKVRNLADLLKPIVIWRHQRVWMYVHYAHGRKLFVAAVMSSPVWNYYDISSNNEKCTIDCKNSNKTLLQNQVPITVSFYSTQIDKKSLEKYIIYIFKTSKSMVLIKKG